MNFGTYLYVKVMFWVSTDLWSPNVMQYVLDLTLLESEDVTILVSVWIFFATNHRTNTCNKREAYTNYFMQNVYVFHVACHALEIH